MIGSSILRWRDFNRNFIPYIETLLSISDDDKDLLFQNKLEHNATGCNCHEVMKCQNLTFPHPLTIDFAAKLWNDNGLMHKTGTFVKYGKTSSVLFRQMKYKNITVMSRCKIVVHIDEKTRKPIAVCSKRKGVVEKTIANMKEIEMNQFNEAHKRLQNAMNRMKNIKCKTKIFEEYYALSAADLDYNEHVTASVFGRKIDIALMKYIDEYYNGKLYVSEIGLIYLNEMKAARDNTSTCHLTVYYYDKTDNEIIGDIKQNDTICAQFRVVLRPLFRVSKL
eukprot:220168_1